VTLGGDVGSHPPSSAEIVVLLHGIGRTSGSMTTVAQHLTDQGYAICNVDYPSRSQSIAELAEGLHSRLQTESTAHFSKTHFVTHSMGGLLVRELMKQFRPENVGRVVMLAPPNQGSEVADFLAGNFLFKIIYGPAGQDLRTGKKALGPVDFPLGVIAGTKSIDPISSLILSGPHDGKVTVENTKVEGMADHLTLPVNHTFLMRDKTVLQQAALFLATGAFDHRLNRVEIA
jgi:triacylglycerol lipase